MSEGINRESILELTCPRILGLRYPLTEEPARTPLSLDVRPKRTLESRLEMPLVEPTTTAPSEHHTDLPMTSFVIEAANCSPIGLAISAPKSSILTNLSHALYATGIRALTIVPKTGISNTSLTSLVISRAESTVAIPLERR